MADITDLLDLVHEVRPPARAHLERVAHRRRRRVVVGITSAVAATVVTIVLAGQPLGMRGATPAPVAPEPTATAPTAPAPTTPSPEPSSPSTPRADGTFRTLTADELRDHPDATTERANPSTGAPGVAARTWSVCLGDCSWETRPPRQGELQKVLEVTSDDFRTGAMHPLVMWDSNISHVVDDWYFVDAAQRAPRLVSSRGDSVSLTRGDATDVGEIAGPLVYSTQGVAWVDVGVRVLHTMNGVGPGGGWDWWGAQDSWFWGSVYRVGDDGGTVVEQGVTWRNADGSFGVRMLPLGDTEWSTQTLRSDRPGTMGVIQPGQRRLLHVSTDYGATWHVRVLPDNWGTGTHVPDDWRSWTDDWPSWAVP